MTDKTKLYESLEKFVDAVASGDEEKQREVIKEYINQKSKKVLEFTGDSAIKLDGDDVLVHGKKVGQVKSDASDMDSGINFVSADGKFSKEFDDVESLYGFISDRFNVKEGVLELSEEELTEGRVEDAVGKQDAGKAARLARWAAVRKAAPADGTPGDYEAKDEGEYVDPVKGGPDAAHDGHELDARHKKGYYDSADVRKSHKDPVKGGSEAAHAGGEADLKTTGGYESKDVRKEHNS